MMTKEQFRELIEKPLINYSIKYKLNDTPKDENRRNQQDYLRGTLLDMERCLADAGLLKDFRKII